MKVVFSDRAYLAVLAETSEKIKTETGGIFLGACENDTWYIIEAIDPGPKSVFQVAYFEYDQKYTEHLINKIARLYDSKLTLIGLWHRHPGSFDQFSSTDDGTNSTYAKLNKSGAISALVNIDPDFRITMYHVGIPFKYTRISHTVGDELIPEHLRRLKRKDKTLNFINGYANRQSQGTIKVNSSHNLGKLIDSIASKFTLFIFEPEDKNTDNDFSSVKDHLIDSLLDDLSYLSENKGVVLSIEQNDSYVSISQKDSEKQMKLHFTYVFTKKQIIFSYNEQCFVYFSGMFEKLLTERDENPVKKNFLNRLFDQ